jgi:DNA-binding NarL/FixJ family response regulator
MPDPTTTRVLIAADHDATRLGMRLALAGTADCSEAENAEAAVEAAVRDRPDVCVLDFRSPGCGVSTAAEIRSKLPEAAVVVMTERVDEEEFLAAVQAGVTGYLSQRLDPSRLPDVIRGVMRGEAAVPRALVPRLMEELRGRERRRHLELDGRPSVELTSREWQVVDAFRDGMSTREIAQHLGISEVTVRRHISAVQQKLGVHRRTELLQVFAGARA